MRGLDARVVDGTIGAMAAEGLSVDSLDAKSCRSYLAAAVDGGRSCTGCGANIPDETREKLIAGRRAECKMCGREATLFAGTVLSGLSIDSRAVVLACAMRKFGRPVTEIAASCKVNPSTISRLLDRLSIPGRP